jgi:HPt (histidine-containing phosphotransfer) domain-containing protein
MDDYLTKPFNKEGLRAVLERWLTPSHQAPAAVTSPAVTPAELASAPVEASIIDDNALANIRKLDKPGAPSIVDRVIDLYFADAPRQISSMRDAIAAADRTTLKRSAHTLKSNSANLGALQLAALCKEMETRAGSESLDGAEDSIVRIELEYAHVRVALADKKSACA